VIGKGAYGCVIRPAVACQGNQAFAGNDAYVSKIIRSQHAGEEVAQARAVRHMLQNTQIPARFFSIPEAYCGFMLDALTLVDQRDCTVIHGEQPDNLRVLQSQYGGKELESFFQEVVGDTQSPDGLSLVTANMLDMLREAILPMNHYGVWHCDLKSYNILVHADTGGVTMIDWGMMKTRTDLAGPRPLDWHFMWNAPFAGTMIKGIEEAGRPYILTKDDVITIMTGQGNYDVHLQHTMATIQRALWVLGLPSEPDNVFQVIDRYQNAALAVLNGDQAPTAGITAPDVIRLKVWFFENVDKWGFVCSFLPLIYSQDPNISRPAAEAFIYMFATEVGQGDVVIPGGASPAGINPDILTAVLGRYMLHGEPMEEGPGGGRGGKKLRGKKLRGKKVRGKKTRGKMVRGRKTRGKKRRPTRRRQ